eukprot:2335613-Prymnesium_polylepis.1
MMAATLTIDMYDKDLIGDDRAPASARPPSPCTHLKRAAWRPRAACTSPALQERVGRRCRRALSVLLSPSPFVGVVRRAGDDGAASGDTRADARARSLDGHRRAGVYAHPRHAGHGHFPRARQRANQTERGVCRPLRDGRADGLRSRRAADVDTATLRPAARQQHNLLHRAGQGGRRADGGGRRRYVRPLCGLHAGRRRRAQDAHGEQDDRASVERGAERERAARQAAARAGVLRGLRRGPVL